jgi:hypothetical protein
MIKTKFKDRLGNQLFVYCLGKILSIRTGFAYIPPPFWLGKRGVRLEWNGEPLFKLQPSPGIINRKNPQIIIGRHSFEFDKLDHSRPIYIKDGWYQRYEHYRAYKKEIRQWLALPKERFKSTDDDAVYVHVRRTDFVNNWYGLRWALGIKEYQACLDHIRPWKRIVLVTDDPKDPFLNEFKKFGPTTIVSESFEDDFMLMASAKKLILSASTFSWWAAFLGKAHQVVTPNFPGTLWDTNRKNPQYNINLIVDDEPRYIVVSKPFDLPVL